MSAKQATVIFLSVLLLLAAGARDRIAHQISRLSLLERLGLGLLVGSLVLLIALRALGIMDIIKILSPNIQ